MIANRAARTAALPRRARRPARTIFARTILGSTIALAAVMLTACAAGGTEAPRSDSPRPTPAASAFTPQEATAPPAAGLAPVSVSIPAIDLVAPLIDLGLAADGTLEVPVDFDEVGWFTGGGRPGGVGPTVIAGHVDSVTAPAVFFRLGELAVGDAVQLADTAGAVHDYEVYRVESFAKNAFPTIDVFGALPTDELRLITCGGDFDTSTGHYDDNLVVYARR